MGNSYWFNPGSFVEGRYVVFDGTQPQKGNPYAETEAIGFLENSSIMLEKEKMEFANILLDLASREESNERAYIQAKLGQLSQFPEVKVRGKNLGKQIQALFNGGGLNAFPAIFNLLLQTRTELSYILRQSHTKKGNSPSTATVFQRKLDRLLIDKISQKLFKKGSSRYADNVMNVTLSTIVDEMIQDLFKDIDLKELPELISEYKKTIIEKIRSTAAVQLPSSWIEENGGTESIQSLKNAIEQYARTNIKVTKRGLKNITYREALRKMIGSLAAGLSLEFNIAKQGNLGNKVSNVIGQFGGKTDVVIIDSIDSEASLDYEGLERIIGGTGGVKTEKLANLIGFLDGFLKEGEFAIAVNAKDYGSNYDFRINSGNFEDIVGTIGELVRNIGSNLDIEEFAFALYNTTKGGFYTHGIDSLLEYIGYVAAAWMFDDISKTLPKSIDRDSKRTLHLFNFNGYYVPLSFILRTAANQVKAVSKESMVNVRKSGTIDVIAAYPSLLGGRNIGKSGVENRWNAIRDMSGRQNRIDIDVKASWVRDSISALRGLLR